MRRIQIGTLSPFVSLSPSDSISHSMLLSPLGSPSRFNTSLCIQLPPLQHDLGYCEDEDDEDVFASDDESECDSESNSASTSSSATSDDTSCDDVDVDVDTTSVHVYVNSDADAENDKAKPVCDADVEAEPPVSPSPFPSSDPDPLYLPVELIFSIVELASTHRRTAVSLCRVSSWVRTAVLPILYGTLVLQGGGALPFDAIPEPSSEDVGVVGLEDGVGRDDIDNEDRRRTTLGRAPLESPLRHVRSLWLDVSPDRAPRSLDACPRLKQLALPLEAHATICTTQRWLAYEKQKTAPNALQVHHIGDLVLDSGLREEVIPCRSFTVLGQSHPHRWAPLTCNPNGRAFLRGVTHLRILNLCLSHYIPLEYTPNLTHLCIPFFDLRISPSSLNTSPSSPTTAAFSFSPTGSAATSSFTGLDYILAHPSLQMVVLTLNPRYWRFDELSLKGWAVRAMARDPRLYVVAETRDDATRDWEVPKRDWEDEARCGKSGSVWEKAICVRRKFLTRLSRSWEAYSS